MRSEQPLRGLACLRDGCSGRILGRFDMRLGERFVAEDEHEMAAIHACTLPLRARRQASEQYLTESQLAAQALRQVMSRPQCWHGLLGR